MFIDEHLCKVSEQPLKVASISSIGMFLVSIMVVYFIADTFKPVIIALIINARRVYKFAVDNEMTDIFRAIHTELSCFTVDLL